MSAAAPGHATHIPVSAPWRLALGVVMLVGLALLLARFPLKLIALCIATPIAGIALLKKPSIGLFALAFSVPFGSLFAVQVAGASVGPSELIIAAMLAMWALRMAADRCVRIRVPQVAWWLAGFVAVGAVSLLWAESWRSAIPELVKWIETWLVMVFAVSVVQKRERLPIMLALLAAGLAEAGLGAYQFLRQVGPEGFVLFGRYMRAYGTFEQPNPYGGYLGLLLPLAYGLVLVGLTDRERGLLWLPYGLVTSAGLAVGLVMSWSRGALLGMACGMALVALSLGKRAWLVALAILPLAALFGPEILAQAPAGFIDRLLDTVRYMGLDLTLIEVTDETFSLVERAAHWQAAWRMFEMRPWLGVGIGQYPVVYPVVSIPRWQDPLGHAHNIYLHLLAEVGLVGLASHLLFLASWLVGAFRQAWRSNGITRVAAIGALGMLGHLLAHNMVDNLYVHGMYLMMGLLLGLMSVSDRTVDERSTSCDIIPETATR